MNQHIIYTHCIIDMAANNQEQSDVFSSASLNSLRAAVLGANDGIVSMAGLIAGVAGSTSSRPVLLAAGLAGLLAGAFSMAAGEYVSVSTQRDTEKALIDFEVTELRDDPEGELRELTDIYIKKGLSDDLARQVAEELTKKDAFAAHVDAELKIDPSELTNPWHAAVASACSFIAGATIPLCTILFAPSVIRVPGTFASVVLALVLTGYLSARASKTSALRAIFRVVVGGILAMVITYFIGSLFKVDVH